MRFAVAVAVASAGLAFVPGLAEATVIPLDPDRTYLHADSTDTGGDAIPVDLGLLGLGAGTTIRLRIVGDYSYCFPGSCSGDEDIHSFSAAVFSIGSTLLDRDQPRRVPGAVDAGVDVLTWDTYFETSTPTATMP